MTNRRLHANAVLIVSLCQITFLATAIAHGGGLNSSGCHNVRKTGGYHCHRTHYNPPEPKTRTPIPRTFDRDKNRKLNTKTLERQLEITTNSQSKSEQVMEAQRYLAYLGFQFGAVDGKIGPKTRAAIQSYQRTRGLGATGKITSQLLAKMANEISQNAKAAQLSNNDSEPTAPTKIVERAQFYLTVLELYTGPKDGVMNIKLEQAIMRFQNDNRLSVDGVPSDRLIAALKSKL